MLSSGPFPVLISPGSWEGEWLRRYRSLKRECDLDEEALENLRDELMESQQVAIDQDGKMLVWTGDGATPPQSAPSQSQPQSPASYTPQHLADRIRATFRAC